MSDNLNKSALTRIKNSLEDGNNSFLNWSNCLKKSTDISDVKNGYLPESFTIEELKEIIDDIKVTLVYDDFYWSGYCETCYYKEFSVCTELSNGWVIWENTTMPDYLNSILEVQNSILKDQETLIKKLTNKEY